LTSAAQKNNPALGLTKSGVKKRATFAFYLGQCWPEAALLALVCSIALSPNRENNAGGFISLGFADWEIGDAMAVLGAISTAPGKARIYSQAHYKDAIRG
jgi:hypothetical protein